MFDLNLDEIFMLLNCSVKLRCGSEKIMNGTVTPELSCRNSNSVFDTSIRKLQTDDFDVFYMGVEILFVL